MSKKFISARPDTASRSGSSNTNPSVSNLHLRASGERQENLRAYAYHVTKEENIRVDLDENAETASIQNYGDDDRATIITVPTFDVAHVENPFPNMNDEQFYAILQYAEIEHEGGHYKYTDQPSVQENFRAIEQELSSLPRPIAGMIMQLSRDLWNAIEDGAMEDAVRKERGPKTAQRLAVKNETFIAQHVKEYPEERKQNVTFDFALHLAAMDLSKYDTGALRRLLDDEDPSWQFMDDEHEKRFMELYPALRQAIEDAFTIPQHAARTDRIFKFVTDHIIPLFEDELEKMKQAETADRDELREGQKDDTENQVGPAQKQQASGLQQNSKQDVAQQHANATQQTVESDASTSDSGNDSDGDETASGDDDAGQNSESNQQSQAGDAGQDAGDGQQQSTPGDTGDTSQDGSDAGESSGAPDAGSEELGAGGAGDEESEVLCPDCGSDETDRLVQTVDGMIAARVNAPFSLSADWVDSIVFISNDELCGFRVTTVDSVPVESIEQQGYKVVDVGNETVEILEPKAKYGDSEQVNGFECTACGHTWVPIIGGDGE